MNYNRRRAGLEELRFKPEPIQRREVEPRREYMKTFTRPITVVDMVPGRVRTRAEGGPFLNFHSAD